ncbi:unnamed protein product, partial [Mesorhabditis belari]|uniref:Uncharacterized protein n=1 Tax=Mesorhabditis belari TaxID=2138241 RepID=A0AAF3EP59_9BILA
MNEPLETILSPNALVALNSDTKIFNACEEFALNRIHRLVILDPSYGDVSLLNRSLHFAQWLNYQIKDTGIGLGSGAKFLRRSVLKSGSAYARISDFFLTNSEQKKVWLSMFCTSSDIGGAICQVDDPKILSYHVQGWWMQFPHENRPFFAFFLSILLLLNVWTLCPLKRGKLLPFHC